MKNLLKKIKNKLLNKRSLIPTITVDHFYPSQNKKHKKKIQNNFFQTYKSNKVDKYFEKKFNDFRIKNPEFNYYFFNDIEMDDYMEKNWSHKKIYQIYKNSIFGASKADIWRYCILYQYGGVYLDFDSSINFSLDSIPNNVNEIISFEKNSIKSLIFNEYTPDYKFLSELPTTNEIIKFPENLVIQWLLVFKKEHPILNSVISQIENYYDFFCDKTFDSIHLASCNFYGPVPFTKAVWDYVLAGNKIFQKGIDFDNQVKFKDISKTGVYQNDDSYYKNFKNSKLLLKNQLRLNLGCGDDIKEGFINIDINKKNQFVKNIEIDNLRNNFKDGTIREIFAKDILEHVGLPTAKKWISGWSNLLCDDGTITLTTPCLDLILEAYSKKKIDEEKLNYLVFAGVFWENKKSYWDTEKTTIYDWHKVCFSNQQLKKLLVENSLNIITEKFDHLDGHINGLNMTIKAKKIKN